MNDINVTTEALETEAPKQNFVQWVAGKAKTKTGKTVLAVIGTASALGGTYVFGFRRGQDNVISVLTADATDEIELELEIEASADESSDSPQD